jgi:hypothetical protein
MRIDDNKKPKITIKEHELFVDEDGRIYAKMPDIEINGKPMEIKMWKKPTPDP